MYELILKIAAWATLIWLFVYFINRLTEWIYPGGVLYLLIDIPDMFVNWRRYSRCQWEAQKDWDNLKKSFKGKNNEEKNTSKK